MPPWAGGKEVGFCFFQSFTFTIPDSENQDKELDQEMILVRQAVI